MSKVVIYFTLLSQQDSIMVCDPATFWAMDQAKTMSGKRDDTQLACGHYWNYIYKNIPDCKVTERCYFDMERWEYIEDWEKPSRLLNWDSAKYRWLQRYNHWWHHVLRESVREDHIVSTALLEMVSGHHQLMKNPKSTSTRRKPIIRMIYDKPTNIHIGILHDDCNRQLNAVEFYSLLCKTHHRHIKSVSLDISR